MFRGVWRPVLLAALLLLGCGGDDSEIEGIRYVSVAELRTGTDTLAIDLRVRSVSVAATPEGGWLVAGLMSGWKWAEFDANGALIHAPGERWSGGGPGEFRDIRYVVPLKGDTVLVVERGMTTRALRDGTYISHRGLPFGTPQDWARFGDAIWVVGDGGSIPLARFSLSGQLSDTYRYSIGDDRLLGDLVVWNDELWLWAYPRGPAVHLDPSTGEVVEEWHPFDDWMDGSRARVASGPEGSLIFNRVNVVDGDAQRVHIVFDPNRRLLLEQVPADTLGPMRLGNDPPAWISMVEDQPVPLVVGVRVMGFELCREC